MIYHFLHSWDLLLAEHATIPPPQSISKAPTSSKLFVMSSSLFLEVERQFEPLTIYCVSKTHWDIKILTRPKSFLLQLFLPFL